MTPYLTDNDYQQEVLSAALPILQGLLASGHYTTPEPSPSAMPSAALYRRDQYGVTAIRDAVDLADRLLQRVKLQQLAKPELE